MDRRTFLSSQTTALGVGLTGLALTAACGRSAPAGGREPERPGVTIAIPLVKAPGRADADVLAQVRIFEAYVGKARGFLSATLLRPAMPNTTFDYLDVTRWTMLQNWKDLYASPDFLTMLRQNNAFTVQVANVLVPA